MNEVVELNAREKLLLGLKIVDFYLRQLETHDHTPHIL